MKAANFSDFDKISTLAPGKSKRLGGKIEIIDDWDEKRNSIMSMLTERKFEPGSALADSLMATSKHILIEGNYWHDQYWGDCSCDKHKNIHGANNLGILLMRQRDHLESIDKGAL